MDGNVEFLNYIHQNAEMGKDTINYCYLNKIKLKNVKNICIEMNS